MRKLKRDEDFRCLDKVDIDMRLLAGDSFYVNGIEIKPYTLREIKDVGINYYWYCCNVFLFEVDDMIRDLEKFSADVINKDELDKVKKEVKNEQIDIYDFLIEIPILTNAVIDSLKLFLRVDEFGGDIFLNKLGRTFFIGKYKSLADLIGDDNSGGNDSRNIKVIDKERFNTIKRIIKMQNCLLSKKDEEYKPVNEKAKEIVELLEKSKKKINKIRSTKDDILTLPDLISILASKGNEMDVDKILDMPFYLFNDQFGRMKILDEYMVNVNALMHGAQKIEFKHYMRKLD